MKKEHSEDVIKCPGCNMELDIWDILSSRLPAEEVKRLKMQQIKSLPDLENELLKLEKFLKQLNKDRKPEH